MPHRQSPIALDTSEPADLPPIRLEYGEMDFDVSHDGYCVRVTPRTLPVMHFGNEPLQLRQFHFHTPAEHTMGGVHYAMALHFVHTDEAGRMTVLDVFGRVGATSDTLARIVAAAPSTPGTGGGAVRLDPATLVPSLEEYLLYEGSLTQPPYTEGVRWIVAPDPIEVSRYQVSVLADISPGNSRKLQPTAGRTILRRRAGSSPEDR